MDRKFTETHHIIHAFPNAVVTACADLFDGSPEGDIISLHGAQRLVFIIITNDVNGASAGKGGSAVLTAEGMASTIDGGLTCALTFHVRSILTPDTATDHGDLQAFTTLGITDTIYEVEIDACQLPACSNVPYEYARLVMTEHTDLTVCGAVVAILDGLRNAEDILPTQVT